MSGIKRLLKRKGGKSKRAASNEDVRSTTSSQEFEVPPGYVIIKPDKELPKLHKAAWTGDLTKVKQLTKKGDLDVLDKEQRYKNHS